MSYLNQLQNLQGDIRARAEHASDVASNIDARKASTIEEKLNSIKDNVEMGLNATTGISGAYHAGRKLYKKYVQKKAPKKAEADEDPAEATESGEAAEGTTPAAPTEPTPAPSDPAAATDANPTLDLPPPGSEIEMQDMANIGVDSTEGASATGGGAAADASTGEEGLAGLGYTEDDAAQLLGDGPQTAATSSAESATATSGDAAGASIPQAKSATDAPDAADGVSSAEGSAATDVGQTAVTQTATDTAVSAGTEAAEGTVATVLETGLDFLGPVGLAVGAIGALFEALFGGKSEAEKQKEAKQKEQEAAQQTAVTTAAGGALATGIDPTALEKA